MTFVSDFFLPFISTFSFIVFHLSYFLGYFLYVHLIIRHRSVFYGLPTPWPSTLVLFIPQLFFPMSFKFWLQNFQTRRWRQQQQLKQNVTGASNCKVKITIFKAQLRLTRMLSSKLNHQFISFHFLASLNNCSIFWMDLVEKINIENPGFIKIKSSFYVSKKKKTHTSTGKYFSPDITVLQNNAILPS